MTATKGRTARVRMLAIGCAVGLVTLAASACVVPPPPTISLAGEYLRSEPPATITSGTCNPAGVSTFTIVATGEATGPYPGTFVETITATVGPQTEEPQPGQFRGDVTSATSVLDITSAAGNVHVTTTLDTTSYAKGVCMTSNVANWTIAGQLHFDVDYEATSGGSVASGSGNMQFNMYDADCSCSGGYQFHHWL